MQITPVVLNLTPMQLFALQEAISYRYHHLPSVVNNIDPHPNTLGAAEMQALRDLQMLMDRY